MRKKITVNSNNCKNMYLLEPGKFFCILFIALTAIVISGCGSKNLSLSDIAKKDNARIGEYNKSYALPPSGGFSVENVQFFPEFDVGQELLKNVVAMTVIGDADSIKTYQSEYGTVALFDPQGNTNININSGVYQDKENDKLFMLYFSDEDISNYTYLALGGFEKDKNDGKSRLAYEITR